VDSLDWNRKFDIFSISRLSLNSSGIPTELVASLSDEDMHAIAERIAEMIAIEPIEKIAEFMARLYLAEKGTRRVSEEPKQQDGET
jgi:hypothetical protein